MNTETSRVPEDLLGRAPTSTRGLDCQDRSGPIGRVHGVPDGHHAMRFEPHKGRAASLSIVLSIELFCMAAAGIARAEQTTSVEDLATLRANPLSGLRNVSLTYQANVDFADGTQSLWELEAVWPFALGKDWSLITNPTVPVMAQPGSEPGEGRVAGLGDTTVTAVVTPTKTGSLIWGVGGELQLPTATARELGSSRWAAGPALGLFVEPAPWTIGVLLENVWSFAGGGGEQVNDFNAEYFLTWNLPRGWFLQSNATVTADWEADDANRWTVPVGGGFGKVFAVGKQSLSPAVQAFYNPVRPSSGPDWSASISLQLLFP